MSLSQGEHTRELILAAMRSYEDAYGLPATLRQVGTLARPGRPLSCGLVSHHLALLVAQGKVTHEPNQARTYRTVRPDRLSARLAGVWGVGLMVLPPDGPSGQVTGSPPGSHPPAPNRAGSVKGIVPAHTAVARGGS